MNILLDTQLVLWSLNDNPRLSRPARDLILDPANTVSISVVTLWEIAIKYPLNRKGASGITIPAAEAHELLRRAGHRFLPVTPAHAVAVESLPPIHPDPFDRLLVAQALTEPLRLVTRDAVLPRYSDSVILV